MTSCDDGLMGDQGFIHTHCDALGSEIAPVGAFLFGDISYKFHACCHGTHAMIEALVEVLPDLGEGMENIASLTLRTNPRWLKVCNNPAPTRPVWKSNSVIRGWRAW
ncbi:hypothetical protein [uncultured Roseibium sp.]|uniref:hypothetical protein n=1 Tax=uncultured Roseibium sp. TaxID=1936171 RepID=UPI003216B655